MKGRTDINLKNEPWFQSPAIATIFNLLQKEGGEVAIVGGAVRNALLHQPVGDVDFATTLTPDEVIDRANAAKLTAIPTGKDHGTITLVIEGHHYEITTLRRDIKTDGRRAEVVFGTDWQEDANRRDFTINALYLAADGAVYDPLGGGVKDIRTKTLHFIGTPQARIREDYLRLLRYYRFAALYGCQPPDQETERALINNQPGLRYLSAERVCAELLKLLAAPDPRLVINLMSGHGLWPVLLAAAPNTKGLAKYIEIETALGEGGDPLLRLGALALHHKGDVERLAKRLRLSGEQQKTLRPLVKEIALPPLTDGEQAKRRHISAHFHLGKTAYLTALKAHWMRSEAPATDKPIKALYQAAKTWPEVTMPVTGEDLIAKGMQPGIALGETLKHLTKIWLEADMRPGKAELLVRLDNEAPPKTRDN